jgi:hypothetical protein
MSPGGPILVKAVAVRVGDVGGPVVEALRRRDLPVRTLVRRDDERGDVSRATGAEVVVAPRSPDLDATPCADGRRSKPRLGKSRSAAVRWAEASRRPMDGAVRSKAVACAVSPGRRGGVRAEQPQASPALNRP